MPEEKNFLEMAFKGRRFQNHLLPLDLMQDLAALNKLLAGLARERYLSETGRSRLPKGFFERSVLCLAGIRQGSAIAEIKLDHSGLFSKEEPFYCGALNDLFSSIEKAENDEPQEISPENLRLFGPLGQKLRNDETLEFRAEGQPAKSYTPSIRKTLVKASGKKYTDNVSLRGEIVECDKRRRMAEIETPHGRIKFKFSDSVSSNMLVESLSEYSTDPSLMRKKNLLLLEGKVTYGTRIRPVYAIRSAEKLSPIDPVYRMEEISRISDNWDGEGTPAPSKDGVNWLTNFFFDYPGALRPPYLCPWEDNTIHAEWRQDGNPLSLNLDIDLDSHIAEGIIHYVDNSKPMEDVRFNLDNEQDVQRLYSTVEAYGDSFLDE